MQNILSQKPKIPSPLNKYMDMDNIAPELSDEDLSEIANAVIEGAETDDESRTKWLELNKNAFEVALYDGKSKNFPWEGAANAKIPLVLSACIQFNARTTPEVIKGERVVKVADMGMPTTPDREDRSARLSNYMSYQLMEESKSWMSDTDKMWMVLAMLGVVYRKSYWDPFKRIPDMTFCLPKDIIVSNNIQSLESAERITHVLYLTDNDLLSNMRAGFFSDYALTELQKDSAYTQEINGPLMQESVSVNGVASFSVDDDKKIISDIAHECYEQHRYLDLDGDGYQEPYIVTVHVNSRKVLRIKARYNETSFILGKKNEIIQIEPINYFTDYHFLPALDGSFHSMGYGVLLAPINAIVNGTSNQLLDAGTMANMSSGFIGSGFKNVPTNLSFKPGEWKNINNVTGDAIRNNIVPLPIKEPSQTLFALMQFMLQSGKELASITDVLQGTVPPPNTPASTVMALIEQGSKVYSAILLRIYDSLKKEFRKLYDLNKQYITEEREFVIANKLQNIAPEDFKLPNYAIFPVANPALSSEAHRMVQAQALMELRGDPYINQQEIRKTYLSLLNIPDTEKYLLPPPDPNAPPPPEAQKLMAETEKLQMETKGILMDRELEALKLHLQQNKQEVDALSAGAQITKDKMDAIADLTTAAAKAEPQTVMKSAMVAKQIDLNSMPPEILLALSALADKMSALEQQYMSSGGQQQVQQPPAGMIPNAEGNVPLPAEQAA